MKAVEEKSRSFSSANLRLLILLVILFVLNVILFYFYSSVQNNNSLVPFVAFYAVMFAEAIVSYKYVMKTNINWILAFPVLMLFLLLTSLFLDFSLSVETLTINLVAFFGLMIFLIALGIRIRHQMDRFA